MDSIKNVLFPTDFSQNAEKALPYAIDIVKKAQGKLFLLYVDEDPVIINADPYGIRDRNAYTPNVLSHDEVLKKFRDIATFYKLPQEQYCCNIKKGDVKGEILRMAELNDIHLIVMGSKGEKAAKALLMESITKDIRQKAICPLLAIPEGAGFSVISKILYASSLTDDESLIINFLINLARLYEANLTIVHVDQDKYAKKWSVNTLKSIVKKTGYPKLKVKEVIDKNPIDGINETVQELKPDILAMTTSTISTLDHFLHKSITKQMWLQTHIPMLTFIRKKYETIFLG